MKKILYHKNYNKDTLEEFAEGPIEKQAPGRFNRQKFEAYIDNMKGSEFIAKQTREDDISSDIKGYVSIYHLKPEEISIVQEYHAFTCGIPLNLVTLIGTKENVETASLRILEDIEQFTDSE